MCRIKNLIAKNKLKEAMEEIIILTARKCKKANNKAILLSQSLYLFLDYEIKGNLNWEDNNKTQRQIASRMLNLLDELELDYTVT